MNEVLTGTLYCMQKLHNSIAPHVAMSSQGSQAYVAGLPQCIAAGELPDLAVLIAEILKGLPDECLGLSERAEITAAVIADVHGQDALLPTSAVSAVISALEQHRPGFLKFGAGAAPKPSLWKALRKRGLAYVELPACVACVSCRASSLSVGGFSSVFFYPLLGDDVGAGRIYWKVCKACGTKHHLSFYDTRDGKRRPLLDSALPPAGTPRRWLQTSLRTAIEVKLILHTENAL